ncbi:glycosyltransferase [Leptolyngbya sp. CCNP1308]|uniref:glycosyltransferase n=1 Tax=Leptolyngbya sp. CCNP1308 TaxID=3110255 RepID=UPI002B1F869B|nr:glycosyltransferase [Leptolyngbya sp. CCNP1308]MEA5452185.1 glycosyltransferase [Leptolyngbya sp. CCNP1308]
MLSVIIPAYNAETTLSAQLDALAQQEFSGNWEIVVGDNGSTDGTLDIIRRYQQTMPQLKVVDASARRGAAHARNMACAQAQGDTLLFCDADDAVAPGWLAAMATAMEKYDLVCGRREMTQLNDRNEFAAALTSIEGTGLLYHPFRPFGAASNLAVKRVHHEAVGGFDGQFLALQDIDYCWRIQALGVTLHEAPDAVVNFRFRGDVRSNFRRLKKFGYYSARLYRKHWANGFPKKMLFRCFLALPLVPVKFVVRVRDRPTLFLWFLNMGWALGYWHAWLDMAKEAVVARLSGGKTDPELSAG